MSDSIQSVVEDDLSFAAAIRSQKYRGGSQEGALAHAELMHGLASGYEKRAARLTALRERLLHILDAPHARQDWNPDVDLDELRSIAGDKP